MNSQLAIDFAPRRLARRTNPATSHAAAARVTDFSAGDYALILRSLREFGPSTYHEIAARYGMEAHKLGRRMNELETAGLIAVVKAYGKDMTRLSPSGRPARVWVLVAGA